MNYMNKYIIINIIPPLDKAEKDAVVIQITSAVYRELVRYAKSKCAALSDKSA